MSFLVRLSDYFIPTIILVIAIYGLLKGVNIYEAFIEGASEGIKVIVQLIPTLVGLMMAVGMLRSSGALDGISYLLKPISTLTGFPSEIIPIVLMRTVSASACMGLVLDIFKTYGPDSFYGRLVSILFGCTETIFYTLSVYFMTVKIKKTRYTLVGALIATGAGVCAAYFLTLYIFGR
jgi:spore maturation protein B